LNPLNRPGIARRSLFCRSEGPAGYRGSCFDDFAGLRTSRRIHGHVGAQRRPAHRGNFNGVARRAGACSITRAMTSALFMRLAEIQKQGQAVGFGGLPLQLRE